MQLSLADTYAANFMMRCLTPVDQNQHEPFPMLCLSTTLKLPSDIKVEADCYMYTFLLTAW